MTEIEKFSYEQLDETTADFLRKKETNMREIVGKAYTELGRELKEAQEGLRKQGSQEGTFMAWYKSIGFKKDAVSRLINRYELFANCEEPTQNLLEDLPVSLTYEIAKPSADSTPEKSQAKEAVLSGEVTTLKGYKDKIAELEQEKESAEKQAAAAQERERVANERAERMEEAEPKTEYVEVERVPEDFQTQFEDLRKENAELRSKYGQGIRKADGSKREELFREFAEDLDYIREKYASILFDTYDLRKFTDTEGSVGKSLNKYDDFWNEFSKALFKDETIINMEAK